MFDHIKFAQPIFLYLLFLIPLLIAWYIWRFKKRNSEFILSSSFGFIQKGKSLKIRFLHFPFILRLLILCIAILIISRPQSSSSKQDISIEGIDIIMAMDISGSMLAEDFKPNRLEASKEVAMDFINGRPNDRVGLVVFSGESFTQCPLTSDHSVLKNLFADIKSGMIDDGTALGEGLANAVNRLRNSKAISKVVILLTDGINNTGVIDPISAAEIAKVFGIRVYTIGVGTKGSAPYPFKTNFGIQYQNIEVQIDEALLQKISEMTNGKYFRATNKKKLTEIYQEIDKLEKSKIDVTEFKRYKDEFLPLALLALFLLILEFVLSSTILKVFPN